MAKKTSPAAPAAEKKPAGAATLTPDAPAPAVVKKEIPKSPAVGAEKSRSTPHEVTWAAIADRAYFLYKNGSPGSAEDHWRQAEHELRGN